MDPTEILAAIEERMKFPIPFQFRWKHKTDHGSERGVWEGHSKTHLTVRRCYDDVVLEMPWSDLEWCRAADHELWGLEVDTREKTYLSKRGATIENCELSVCDIILPLGSLVEPNYDANEYTDHIATLPTGEKIMFFLDRTGFSGWVTGIINARGELVMGHYPHDDTPCAHY